jgi:hypothetical protein
MSRNPRFNLGDSYRLVRSRVLATNLSSSEDETELYEGNEFFAEDEIPEDIQAGIAERHRQNLEFLVLQVKEKDWTLHSTYEFDFSETVSGLVEVIKKPTASKIDHRCLTPWIYRTLKIGLLDTIARVVRAPDDWHHQYLDKVSQSRSVLGRLNTLTSLQNFEDEGVVEIEFSNLVNAIASSLEIYTLKTERNTTVIVGGILADEKYDIRSKADVCFRINRGPYLICTEVKTINTFPVGCMWHNRCRGVQTLAALFGFDCPAFLVSQYHFKLFVQNTTRDGILTFPYRQDPNGTSYQNSSLVAANNEELLKAITICLLSKKATEPSSPVLKMVENEEFMPKHLQDSAEKPKHQNSIASQEESQIRNSKVITGYSSQGNPIYRQIRVLSRNQVAAIEDEIHLIENQENLENMENLDFESEYLS